MVNNKMQLLEAYSKTNRAMVELEDIYDIQSKRKEISEEELKFVCEISKKLADVASDIRYLIDQQK